VCVHAAEEAGQKPLAPEVARALEGIRGESIVGHARVLSDPAMHGREAGSASVRKAATYIAERFQAMGLRPGAGAGSYYQVFKIRLGYRMASELSVHVGTDKVAAPTRGEDYMPIGLPNGKAEVDAEFVLAGYGITSPTLGFDEYGKIEARGRAVLVFSGTPWSPNTAGWLRNDPGVRDAGTLAYKARNASAHGATCLLVVDDPAGWRRTVNAAERLRIPDTAAPLDSPIPVIHVTREFAAQLTALSDTELRLLATDIAREREPESMLLRGRRLTFKASVSGRAWTGRNVVGVVPGRDETLRRQAVVVGAHYDHIGEGAQGTIFFGANDNAAGVGAMLEVAQAVQALSRPPRRSLVFVAFDAEEIGRLGSKNYVAKPTIPMAQTTLMINFDMIGRNEPDHIHAVGTRSSPELHELHQKANQHVGLRLGHPESFRLGRSDHSPFYFADVPILYLFGGLDADYNTPRDTWDRLVPGKVEKVARLAFLTALDAAERDARLSFDKNPPTWEPSLKR